MVTEPIRATARTPQVDQASRAAALAALTGTGDEALKAELLGTDVPEGVTATPRNAPVTALARATPVAVSRYAAVSDGAVEGEFDETDTRHPTLKIVQGSGSTSEKFSHGTLILGDEEVLPPPPADPAKAAAMPPLRFFPVQIKKQFQEVLPEGSFADGIMPKIVDTLEEVTALGGTLQYMEGATNRWRACGRILMLVERPEGCDHPLFSIELDGKVYAPAVYFASGGGYAATIKAIFGNKVSLFVTEGSVRKLKLWKHPWTFRVTKKKAGDFIVFRPEVRMQIKEQFGPELDAFAKSYLTGAPEQQALAE